ncbi:MAG: type II toxin-antitoxin system Phd/YefM family antitoxin [Jiangellaceae bacterium]
MARSTAVHGTLNCRWSARLVPICGAVQRAIPSRPPPAARGCSQRETSAVLRAVETGESVVVTKDGQEIAKIVPLGTAERRRRRWTSRQQRLGQRRIVSPASYKPRWAPRNAVTSAGSPSMPTSAWSARPKA